MPQASSRAAAIAFVAAHLEHIPRGAWDAYFAELGLKVRRNGAERAAAALRPHRDWMLIDAASLNLESFLVRMPGRGRPRDAEISGLSQVAGVRTLMEGGYARDLYAIVVTEQGCEGDARAAVSEVVGESYWERLIREVHEPAVRTWRHLARTLGLVEGLTDSDPSTES